MYLLLTLTVIKMSSMKFNRPVNGGDRSLRKVACAMKLACLLVFASEIVHVSRSLIKIKQTLTKSHFKRLKPFPGNIYLFKFSNGNTRKRCGICSKSAIKTPERSR